MTKSEMPNNFEELDLWAQKKSIELLFEKCHNNPIKILAIYYLIKISIWLIKNLKVIMP
ncbi:MAG: hypothetical protein PWR08_839 [Thermoanaerobacterium sp.]|nr:hypothetical protein [Thermoanaerobacterium sp.]